MPSKAFLYKDIDIAENAMMYLDIMMNECGAMFEYPSLEENGIEIETLLQYAMVSGCAGIYFDEREQKYKCGKLKWSDIVDDNGIAAKCVLTGATWSKEIPTEKVAFLRNYHTQQPERKIVWFADMFAQIDDAQSCLIENTKYTPVPVASNQNEKEEYEAVLKRKQAGEKITVMLRPAANPLLQRTGTNQDENCRILNLTDTNMIEKMHYLSEYHAEIKKRFATMYGMCFKSSSKSAQETVDEVHGMDNFSLIIPSIKLKELKKFADMCKEKFGWAGAETAKYSELWQREDEAAEEACEPEEESIKENEEAEEKEGEENAAENV